MRDILFLAFAPGTEDDFLLGVDEEIRDIQQALEKVPVEVQVYPQVDVQDLIQSFIDCAGNIRILHYGGHANGYEWLVHQSQTQPQIINAGNLAKFLQKQQLELVFLNGCATEAQAQHLMDVGIRHVIATSQRIEDQAARVFAKYFYHGLVNGSTISEAFERASHAMELSNDAGILRSWNWDSQTHNNTDLPWKLFSQERSHWTLPTHRLDKEPQWLTDIPAIHFDDFIGREKELAEIRQSLLYNHQPTLIQGFGGVGKSCLVKAYTQRYRLHYQYVAWVETPSDSSTVEVLASNTDLHLKLELQFPKRESAEVKALKTLQQLAQLSERTLLIIDNATLDLETLFTRVSFPPAFHFLITSRNHFASCYTLTLDHLPIPQARALFIQLYPQGSTDRSLIDQLLSQMDYHTLTIELVAKTLAANRQLDMEAMLDKLANDQLQQQQVTRDVWTGHSSRYVTIYQYLLSVFELSGLDKVEKDLLLNFSVLPDTYIPGEQLLTLLQVTLRYPALDSIGKKLGKWFSQKIGISKPQSVDAFAIYDNALNALVRKGWLDYQFSSQSFRCHPMMQFALRSQFTPSYVDCMHVVLSVNQKLYLESTQPEETWEEVISDFEWIPYGESLIKHLKIVYEDEYPSQSTLSTNLGFMQYMNGNYQRAKELMESGVELLEAFPKHKNQVPPIILFNKYDMLATVYASLGEYKKAYQVQKKGLAFLGDGAIDPMSWYKGMLRLHYYYGQAGEYDTQKEIMIQLSSFQLTAGEMLFGGEVQQVMQMRAQGQWEGVFSTVLGWYDKITEDLEDMDSDDLSYFTQIYLQSGLYDEAYEMVYRSLKELLKKVPEDHPLVAFRRFLLSQVEMNRGEWESARILAHQVKQSHSTNFGPKHPNTISAQAFLASTCYYLGKYQEAQHEILEAIDAMDKSDMNNEEINLIYRNLLSKIYDAQGLEEKALHVAKEVVDTAEKLYQLPHHMLMSALITLAEIYNNKREYASALSIIENIYTFLVTKVPTDPRIASIIPNLIHLYHRTSNFDKAHPLIEQMIPELKETIRKMSAMKRPSNLYFLQMRTQLGRLLFIKGEYRQAIQLFEEILDDYPHTMYRRPLYPTINTYYAEALLKAGHKVQAMELLQSAYQMMKGQSGPNHPFTRMCEHLIIDNSN